MSLIPTLSPSSSHSLAVVSLERELPPIRRTTGGSIDFDWYLLRPHKTHRRSFPDAFRAIGRRLRTAFAAWVRSVREHRAKRRALAELLSLDDRSLRDMGLNRAGVYFAVDHGREDAPPAANINDKPARAA